MSPSSTFLGSLACRFLPLSSSSSSLSSSSSSSLSSSSSSLSSSLSSSSSSLSSSLSSSSSSSLSSSLSPSSFSSGVFINFPPLPPIPYYKTTFNNLTLQCAYMKIFYLLCVYTRLSHYHAKHHMTVLYMSAATLA